MIVLNHRPLSVKAKTVLVYVREHPGATGREVSESLALNRDSANGVLETLTYYGYILRRPDMSVYPSRRWLYYAALISWPANSQPSEGLSDDPARAE